MNLQIIIGNLGRDVELRQTQGGTAVATLSIATTDRVRRGEEWVDETDWHRVIVFGRMAENASRFLPKGSKVGVVGRIKHREYKDRDGSTKYVTEVLADRIEFLSKPANQSGGQSGDGAGWSGSKPRASGWGDGGDNADADYIPF